MESIQFVLEVKALSLKLGSKQALDHLDLEIRRGEVFGLLGPNGAGKTTLIKIITGLLASDAGEIRLFEKYLPGSNAVRPLIGYMPQEHSVYPNLSIWENILFYGRMYQVDKSRLFEYADEVLELTELKNRKDDLVSELSGGMIRRVMLATALVHKPSLLILDEPTAGVDPLLRIKFWDWFSQMTESGTSIIVTTHNISEASRCQNVVFLREGKKLAQGSPKELIKEYQSDNLESAFVEATRSTGMDV